MAFPAFLRAAKALLPEASFAAASCLEVGKWMPMSFLTARYYYTVSAEAGYFLAMHRMAAGLLNGEIGFERDEYAGIKWLEKCAAYRSQFVMQVLARHWIAQMRAESGTNEGMLMEDAGLGNESSRRGLGGIFGEAEDEGAARDALRRAMQAAESTFAVARGEDRRFGIVKARWYARRPQRSLRGSWRCRGAECACSGLESN
ncbi:hypothetical protein BC830DRAFT_20883 [Chytriomyces sp. MP71]|nr:hypothetical protein BC830DRAFT_20883 [Chytriomyces sp. MP71]